MSSSILEVVDSEIRERRIIRSKVKLSRYFSLAMYGYSADGAEAELCEAANVPLDSIPLEIFDTIDMKNHECPEVFSNTLAYKAMRISLSRSQDLDTYVFGKITDDRKIETQMTKRKSVESIPIEVDWNFMHFIEKTEDFLRQEIYFILQLLLDNHVITNMLNILDGSSRIFYGKSFDEMNSAFVEGVDGYYACSSKQVHVISSVELYKLAHSVYRNSGSIPFGSYATNNFGGFCASCFISDSEEDGITEAIMHRSNITRTAVCPNWGSFSIARERGFGNSGTGKFYLKLPLGGILLSHADSYRKILFQID